MTLRPRLVVCSSIGADAIRRGDVSVAIRSPFALDFGVLLGVLGTQGAQIRWVRGTASYRRNNSGTDKCEGRCVAQRLDSNYAGGSDRCHKGGTPAGTLSHLIFRRAPNQTRGLVQNRRRGAIEHCAGLGEYAFFWPTRARKCCVAARPSALGWSASIRASVRWCSTAAMARNWPAFRAG